MSMMNERMSIILCIMVYLLNRLPECFLIMIGLNCMMKRIVKLKIVMIQ